MSFHSLRSSKFWLYAGSYLLFCALGILLFYPWRSPSPSASPKTQAQPTGNTCMTVGNPTMEGVFALTPKPILETALTSTLAPCEAEICQLLDEEGRLTPQYGPSQDDCLDQLTEVAVNHHNDILESLPLLPFFFHSGKSTMSKTQKNQLNYFLKAFEHDPGAFGAIVIARASAIGNSRNNESLSEKRALAILDQVDRTVTLARSDYIYFGDRPPALTTRLATDYGISPSEYEDIRYGRGSDPDFHKRLNQSAILAIYALNEDPFGLNDE